MTRPRVYISGPITLGDRQANIAQAIEWYDRLIEEGFAPFCPHLSCFAEDAGVKYEHEVWIEMDLRWVEVCDAVLRLPGESKGADEETAHARKLGIPVVEESDTLDALRALDVAFLKPPQGDPRFHAYLKKMGALHDKKQADYGADRDAFANVRAAQDFGAPPVLGVAIRMNDKMNRIKSFFKKGKLQNESVRDSFLDLAVYGIIGLVLMDEEHGA
jgi:hypothetical protein